MKGADCICISLNFLNTVWGTSDNKVRIGQIENAMENQVKMAPYKACQRFLSQDSEQDHFKGKKKTFWLTGCL